MATEEMGGNVGWYIVVGKEEARFIWLMLNVELQQTQSRGVAEFEPTCRNL